MDGMVWKPDTEAYKLMVELSYDCRLLVLEEAIPA